MTVTAFAKNKIMLLFTGSNLQTGSEYVTHFIIGTGSTTVSGNQTTLATATDRQILTSLSYISPTKVEFQADWGQNEVSGTTSFKEFGLIGSATGLTGSIWDRTVMAALTFDGSNELRIQNTLEIF